MQHFTFLFPDQSHFFKFHYLLASRWQVFVNKSASLNLVGNCSNLFSNQSNNKENFYDGMLGAR